MVAAIAVFVVLYPKITLTLGIIVSFTLATKPKKIWLLDSLGKRNWLGGGLGV